MQCITLTAQQMCPSRHAKIIYQCNKIFEIIMSGNMIRPHRSTWSNSNILVVLCDLIGNSSLDSLSIGQIPQEKGCLTKTFTRMDDMFCFHEMVVKQAHNVQNGKQQFYYSEQLSLHQEWKDMEQMSILHLIKEYRNMNENDTYYILYYHQRQDIYWKQSISSVDMLSKESRVHLELYQIPVPYH